MKNLYSFSKNAWFVKLYKWLYDVDPTQKYKNMCPMFWAMVITFILLPFMVILKLCGNLSTKFYAWKVKRKQERWEKDKIKFIEYCNRDLTPKEAYKLYRSNDWSLFSNYITHERWHIIYDLKSKYTPSKNEKLIDIDWSQIILIIIFILGIYTIILLLYKLPWNTFDFKEFCIVLLKLANFSIFCVGFYHIFKYFFINSTVFNFFNKIGTYISKIANKVWHGIQIVSDMIYNIYKKNCPLIEWTDKDEESNKI
jgi:hypothetical protein